MDTDLEQFVVPPEVEAQYGIKIQGFEEALATYGLAPEDIDIIIHTHLHNDHCENDYKCTNARVYAQNREYDFFKNPHRVDHRYFPVKCLASPKAGLGLGAIISAISRAIVST